MSIKRIITSVVFCWFLFGTSISHAYNVYRDCPQISGSSFYTWPSSTVDWRVRAAHFNNSFYQSIKNGADEYALILGSNIDVNTIHTNSSNNPNSPPFIFGNGVNEMYKVWNDWPNNSGTIGYAKYSYTDGFDNDCSGFNGSGYFVEGDVWINPTTTFTATDSATFATANPIPHIGRVAMHEFGHLIGHVGQNDTPAGAYSFQFSSHEGQIVTTMNSGDAVSGGGILGGNEIGSQLGDYRNKLHADDAAYLRLLYPGGSSGYDVSGSRWRDDTADNIYNGGPGGIVEYLELNANGTTSISRGQGYYMPYTIQNQSDTTVDVKVEVWFTQDGKLDGQGSDIKLTHNGSPLYHLYTMNSDGHIPGQPIQTSNSSTIENKIYFEIPNDASQFPNGLWTVGYNVSMPYLPNGSVDRDLDDNWVSMRFYQIIN